MTHRILLFQAAVTAAAHAPGPRTLRLDYVHTGMATEENLALDGVVREGASPGLLDRWTDESNLGKYYFQVLDPCHQSRDLLARLCQHIRENGIDHQRGGLVWWADPPPPSSTSEAGGVYRKFSLNHPIIRTSTSL